jgi:DNA-binding MurR/RpiR family transcriptional regulator
VQELQRSLDPKAFGRAVDLLATTDAIWVVGSRRSFPVAAYLGYALQHTDKRVQLVTALGSMHEGELRAARRGDVLVVVSFAPYAEETLAVAQSALARGARLVTITDSRMSPLAREASAVLLVQDHATFGFRTLTSPMALAQSLFIALACRLELEHEPALQTTS